jgi:hypothetical protein
LYLQPSSSEHQESASGAANLPRDGKVDGRIRFRRCGWIAANQISPECAERKYMAQSDSKLPISIFLARLAADSGKSRSDFVASLGYRNIERGRRCLDLWLDQGEGHERILKQVAAIYPLHVEELQAAIVETAKVKAAQAEGVWLEDCRAEQATFVPYIHVEGETSLPNGITLSGISGGLWNLIEIPHTILDFAAERAVRRTSITYAPSMNCRPQH